MTCRKMGSNLLRTSCNILKERERVKIKRKEKTNNFILHRSAEKGTPEVQRPPWPAVFECCSGHLATNPVCVSWHARRLPCPGLAVHRCSALPPSAVDWRPSSSCPAPAGPGETRSDSAPPAAVSAPPPASAESPGKCLMCEKHLLCEENYYVKSVFGWSVYWVHCLLWEK